MHVQGENTQEVDREFLAWLAGFWEGEGSFSLRESKYRHPRLSINQGDRSPLDLIQKKLGVGKVYEQNKGKAGRFSKKPIYKWDVWRRDDVIAVARAMLPFLKFRREVVQPKLEFLEKLDRTHMDWTNAEDEFLIKNFHLPQKKLAMTLKRSIGSVQYRLQRVLKLRKLRRYHKEEYELVMELRKNTGFGARRLSRMTNIPSGAIDSWIYKSTKPLEAKPKSSPLQ